MSWLFKSDDYKKEHHNNLGYRRKNQRVVQTKIKLPTLMKSQPCWCRNCNKRNTDFVMFCIQCNVDLAPKGRKRRTPLK